MRPGYVLTTPMFNEREVLPVLLESVDALVPGPTRWVVVDDHSTDGSFEWLTEQAATRPGLSVLKAPEAHGEYLGGHVARIKRWGLSEALRWADDEGDTIGFGGVLDADIRLPTDHYARLLAAFDDDPRLGVTSSILVMEGEEAPEGIQRTDEPRGGTQFFRRACLEAIGGLPPYPGYDGAANIKARAQGYGTRLLDDVVAIHRRDLAGRYGAVEGYRRRGRYSWFLGLHPLMVAARGAAYAKQVGVRAGVAYLEGWGRDALSRAERCPDDEVRRGYGRRRLVEAAAAAVGRGRAYRRRR